nr:amidase family protein [Erythrobacter sp.]
MKKRSTIAFTWVAATALSAVQAQDASDPYEVSIGPGTVPTSEPVQLPAGIEVAATIEEARAVEAATLIAAYDDGNNGLNAVISLAPDITAQVRAAQGRQLPLNARTVLVKDNIETRELPTTAGSLVLKDNMTGRDAPMIANLRAAGGVVMGKTNLSEWANIRSNDSTSGWSAVGGLTRNPHATDRNSCGSSSGSGAAVAAGFAWAAIGTETNGSITCPASINGVVGFKPSVGLVSRTHVVPISSTQDTAGPMTKTVYDAALLLSAIAGEDPADAATVNVPRIPDYTDGIAEFSLEGVRIGVMRNQIGNRDDVRAVFGTALEDLERAGAVLVDIEFEMNNDIWNDSFTILLFELREEMGKYLQSIPAIGGSATPRSLADLIAFNEANAETEMRWFDQGIFEQAEATTDRDAYEKARSNALRIAGPETLDTLYVVLREQCVERFRSGDPQGVGPRLLIGIAIGRRFSLFEDALIEP